MCEVFFLKIKINNYWADLPVNFGRKGFNGDWHDDSDAPKQNVPYLGWPNWNKKYRWKNAVVEIPCGRHTYKRSPHVGAIYSAFVFKRNWTFWGYFHPVNITLNINLYTGYKQNHCPLQALQSPHFCTHHDINVLHSGYLAANLTKPEKPALFDCSAMIWYLCFCSSSNTSVRSLRISFIFDIKPWYV